MQPAVEAIHRTGATSITCGYVGPPGTPPTAGPDGPVVWWFEATYPGGRVRGESPPTPDPAWGLLEAAAVILRGAGHPVTVVFDTGSW